MRHAFSLVIGFGLIACGETAPRTGVMPGTANDGYDAPSNAEAAAAYMSGFQARFDIQDLDYPEDIKDRIKAARRAKFQQEMQNAKVRQEFIAKLSLTLLAQKDPEAKRLLKDIKKNPKQTPDAQTTQQIFAMLPPMPKRNRQSNLERDQTYSSAVRRYKAEFRNLNIDTCRWTQMKRLIGSGHEEMALIHGQHPEKGFRCTVDLTIEKNKGYPRVYNFDAFWVRSQSGDWQYFGTFRAIEVEPRLQRLNQDLLRDPEGTIMRQSTFDMMASAFN